MTTLPELTQIGFESVTTVRSGSAGQADNLLWTVIWL